MPKGLPRFCDGVIAFVGLILSMPLLVLTAMAIRLTSNGPIIFRQTRVGLKGRPFTLFKFRTMHLVNSGLQVTASDDARVTRVGKILRKFKLDELPELWNVLKGDMSFVGPRPEVERYVDLNNPAWQIVLQSRPGITDPVTLKLRNEENLLADIKSDRERFYLEVLQPYKLKGYSDYLHRRSWQSDLHVLYLTAVAVLFPNTATLPTVDELNPLSSRLPCRNT